MVATVMRSEPERVERFQVLQDDTPAQQRGSVMIIFLARASFEATFRETSG